MTLLRLPEANIPSSPKNLQWDVPSDVFAQWAPVAAIDESESTISIYDVIGEDYWTGGGFTAKRMSGALRSIGPRDVTVRINSPGGDLMEGLSIFNMLRSHPHKVTVEVMGWAASAASIIAMAGDEIVMGVGTFMMVHNAWGVVVGNRHDLADAAKLFEQFDSAITDVYEARTGVKRQEIAALMDAETFLGASDAVGRGFADRVDNELRISTNDAAAQSGDGRVQAIRRAESALSKSGMSRRQARALISEIKSGERDAATSAVRDAGAFAAGVRQLLTTLTN